MNSATRPLGILFLCLLLPAVGCKQVARSYFALGNDKREKGDLDGALAEYNSAIRLDPTFVAAYDNRGLVKRQKGDIDGAMADFNRCIDLDPKDAFAYQNRGEIKAGDEDHDGAMADFDRAIALNPQLSSAYDDRGRVKMDKEDADAALADFNHAISLDPDDGTAYIYRGYADKLKGDLDAALADENTAIDYYPQSSFAYRSRGDIKESRGDLDGAIADYTHAIDLDPKDAYAHSALGLAKTLQRDWPGALAEYRLFCKQADHDTYLDYAQLQIWLLRARMGETDAATKELAAYLSTRVQTNRKASAGDWAAKLGGFLTGSITEQELFAAGASSDAKKDGDQHCEAWFYAGMKKLLAGDKVAAADYFHKCLATDKKDYVEYQMAQSELKVLGG